MKPVLLLLSLISAAHALGFLGDFAEDLVGTILDLPACGKACFDQLTPPSILHPLLGLCDIVQDVVNFKLCLKTGCLNPLEYEKCNRVILQLDFCPQFKTLHVGDSNCSGCEPSNPPPQSPVYNTVPSSAYTSAALPPPPVYTVISPSVVAYNPSTSIYSPPPAVYRVPSTTPPTTSAYSAPAAQTDVPTTAPATTTPATTSSSTTYVPAVTAIGAIGQTGGVPANMPLYTPSAATRVAAVVSVGFSAVFIYFRSAFSFFALL
ncbi:hypothetical protein BC830DRAFT_1084914 [Chytriomyces sp. MP71]|nr:hypothetical protein BC830DRAFT_1084914 [Chytriomyces sp. MP71]